MAISYVSSQSCNGQNGSNNSATFTITGSNAVSNGNTICVMASGIPQSGGTVFDWSISDNAGNTYTAEVEAADGGGGGYAGYVCKSSSGNPTQFTLTSSAGSIQWATLLVDVFSGVDSTAGLGVGSNSQNGPGTSSDAITTANTATSSAGVLWSAMAAWAGGAAAGTGFTLAQKNEGTFLEIYSEYQTGFAGGSTIATWTNSTNGGTSGDYFDTVAFGLVPASSSSVTGSVNETLGSATLSAHGAFTTPRHATLSETLGAATLSATASTAGVQLVSDSFVNWAGNRIGTTITAPTGIQDGDVLVIGFVIEAGAGYSISPPSGFSLVPGPTYPVSSSNPGGSANLDNYLYYKIAKGESGNYSVSHTDGATAAWMACFTGNDLVTPVTNASSATGTGATTTIPGITTTRNGSLCVFAQQDYGYKELSNNLSGPTGYTPLNTWAEVNNLYASYELQSTAGATGSLSITNNNGATSFGWAGFQFAIQPPPSFAGRFNNPLGALTLAATGVFSVELVESATLGSLSIVATGKVTTFQGAGVAETLGSLSLSGTGHLTSHATASDTLGTLTVVATGIFKQTAHATANVTLGTLTVSGGMASDDPGNLNVVLGAVTLVATATRPAHATLSQTLGVATGSAILSPIIKLTGSDTLAALTMVGRARNLATDHFTLSATLGSVTATFITGRTKFDTVNVRTYATVTPYQPNTPPLQQDSVFGRYLLNELKKLSTTLQTVTDAATQSTAVAPLNPKVGWVRLATGDWAKSLPNGEGLYVYKSTGWTHIA